MANSADQIPGVYVDRGKTYVLDKDFGWWKLSGLGLDPLWAKPSGFDPVRVDDLPELIGRAPHDWRVS